MSHTAVLGLDVGTSSLKATILNDKGRLIQNRNYGYPVHKGLQGIVAADVYENTVLSAISDAVREFRIISVGLSTQMYSLCEDIGDKKFIHQWNSLWTGSDRCDEYFNGITNISGCPADTIFPAYKLYSLGDEARKNFLPYGLKEHLINFLTGNLCTDYATASASGFFDIRSRGWHQDLLDTIGFSPKDMPVAKKHYEPAGMLKNNLMIGLGVEASLVPGLGDGPSASYACRPISDVCCNIGTSMAIRTISGIENRKTTRELWVFAYDDDSDVIGGISSNGCSIFAWADGIGWNVDSTAGIDGVMFFPWLHGERTPYWSSNLRGAFLGLDINSDQKTIDAAVTKGVAFTFCRLAEALSPFISPDAIIAAAGGGTRNDSLIKIISGTLPFRIGILNEFEYLASYGAAASAAAAIGIEPEKNIFLGKVIETTDSYRDEYARWRRVGDQIAEIYSIEG
jgi:gluconokinase